MVDILKFIETKNGRILLSVMWGFGLACLFKKVCDDRNCIVYKAPNVKEITNGIYKHGDKCYKYKTENVKCTKDKNIIQ